MPNFFIWLDFMVLQIFNNQEYVLKKSSSAFLAYSGHLSIDIPINTFLLKKKQEKTRKQAKKAERN